MYKLPKQKRGFTLVELLVVISIIGVLASVVLAAVADARVSARDAARIQEFRQLITALELYRNANGVYPCYRTSATCTSGVVVIDRVPAVSASTNFRADMSSYMQIPAADPQFSDTSGSMQYVTNATRTVYAISLRREGAARCRYISDSAASGFWGSGTILPFCF